MTASDDRGGDNTQSEGPLYSAEEYRDFKDSPNAHRVDKKKYTNKQAA